MSHWPKISHRYDKQPEATTIKSCGLISVLLIKHNVCSTNLFVFGFLGPVSRVAIILTKELQKEKRDTDVKRLDKEYLRSVLTEKDAMARSRRSDEVLVYRGTSCAKLLEINLENPGERILAPGFEG